MELRTLRYSKQRPMNSLNSSYFCLTGPWLTGLVPDVVSPGTS